MVFVILLSLGGLYYADHPGPTENIIKIECKWYDSTLHTMGQFIATSDHIAIARITNAMDRGRLAFPLFSKLRVVATIKLTDTKGNEQQWSLLTGNTIRGGRSSKTYSIGPDFEAVLREALLPLPIGDAHTDSAATSSPFTLPLRPESGPGG